MADHKLNEFTDNLITRGIFSCGLCSEWLIPPIFMVEDINVCSRCYEEQNSEKNWPKLNNTSLEIIIQELNLPCKYKSRGCTARKNCIEIKSHEEDCKFRTKLCPMYKFLNCIWEGNSEDLNNHFLKHHTDHIITGDGNFTIKTEIVNEDFVKLLSFKKEAYILKMQIDCEKNRLFYIVCHIRDDVTNNTSYSVKHKGNSENHIKTKSKILSSACMYKDIDKNVAVQVDLEALKHIIDITDNITSTVKIHSKNQNEEFEEKLLQFVECPVCKFFMRPPIFQCQSGHSICHQCRPKLEKCPTCRASFGSTRNYSLEALTAGVNFPCMYHDFGCSETFVAGQATKHENVCPLKPYNCPLQGCVFKGNHQVVKAHLREFHADKIVGPDCTGYTESFRLDHHSIYGSVFDRRCLITFGHIFRLTCKRISDMSMWAAEIVGARDESKTFIYEISIIDMRRPHKKLIRTDLCLNEMYDEELFKKCIMFPNSILSSYSSNGTVSYQFKIKEK